MIDGAYAVAGALTGFVVGLTGVGGGALMTPLLLLVFGVPPTTAVATDLWFAAITKLVGARVHQTNGNVDWQVARRLWSGSLPAALLVVVLVSLGLRVGKIEWLSVAIGVLVLVAGVGLLVGPKLAALASDGFGGLRQSRESMRRSVGAAAGAVLGVCVALTSVGAGALGSVMLMYLYPSRMTPHRLVATDIVHAIPLAMIAGVGYLLAGLVDWWMLASLLLGSVPAVIAGSLLAGKFSGRFIQISLALVLIAAGVKVLS